jgi:3-methyladenine DNA glycosylase Tag
MSSGTYQIYVWDTAESTSDELYKRMKDALEAAGLSWEHITWEDE